MCFLAYDESKNNQYKPFFSYGLTENVDGHLVGTSFHNFDMPLIRYDTGDLIASENFILDNGVHFRVGVHQMRGDQLMMSVG